MRKLYTIASERPIACLGGIQGPLTTPTPIGYEDIITMITKGYVIYQHNPVKLTEKVRVTRANVNSIKFETTRAKAAAERALNKEIQQMATPVDKLVKKATEIKNAEKNPKAKEETTEKTEAVLPEEVSKPDVFQKS